MRLMTLSLPDRRSYLCIAPTKRFIFDTLATRANVEAQSSERDQVRTSINRQGAEDKTPTAIKVILYPNQHCATMRSMSFQDLFVKSASEPARLPPATSLLSPSSAFDGLSSYDAAATPKGSIDFILDDASHAAVKMELSTVPGAEQAGQELRLATPTSTSSKRGRQDAEATTPSAPKRKKRKARICKEPGCDKYVVDHGLCIRHGVCAVH